jgi:type II secretory pathway predicted ATPase ExeA
MTDAGAAERAVLLAAHPWHLVGRVEEERHVADLLEGGGHVVLAGSAGVGKTRLARELIAAATASGRPTVWNTATRAARAVPFGALLSMIPGSRRDVADRMQLFAAVVDGVGRLGADGTRPLVVIDDAHLLDDASAALVLHVAVSGAASVLVTLRSG